MTKRVKVTRYNAKIFQKLLEDMGSAIAEGYKDLFDEADLPIKASETEITTLYKYRPVGEQIVRSDGTTATQDVVNILKKCTLYAAMADKLNDPFEVRLRAGNVDSKKIQDFMNKIREELLRGYPHLQGNDLFQEIKDTNSQNDKEQGLEWVQEAIMKLLEDDFKNIRILSLSSKNNDPLMWSHYAGGYNGVCLGFGVNEGNIFGEALEVQYKEAPIYYTLGDAEIERMMEDATMTKMKNWSYEKEWRVIVRNYLNPAAITSNLSFKPKWITEMIFGLRIEENVKTTLIASASHIPEIKIGYIKDISSSGDLTIEWEH